MASVAFLALGLFTFGILAESKAVPVSGKVVFFASRKPQIYDPNGVITCSNMDRDFISGSYINHGSLTYVPSTGEILHCGGYMPSKAWPPEAEDQCRVINNMEFVPHSHLTQQHRTLHHTAVINGTVWVFGGVERAPFREGYVIESLAGKKWSIKDEPRTPMEHNYHACSVFTGEALVLIGGAIKSFNAVQDEQYGPTAAVSKLIPGSSHWESLSPLPAPRDNHGCVYLQPNQRFPNGGILVAGGSTWIGGSEWILKDCEKCLSDSVLYDISQDSWIPAGEIGASHAQGSLVDVDGRIIFAGGIDVCSGALINKEDGKGCFNIKRTARVDEFHLENLGTDKPTWTKMNRSLSMMTSAAAAVIPIQHWNDGKSCKIPDPLPTPPPPPATQGVSSKICLSSPNYPSNYPKNMRSNETFSVPAGEDIEITIMDMDLEGIGSTNETMYYFGCKDFIRFYDGKGNAVKVRHNTDICERHGITEIFPGRLPSSRKFLIPTSSASVYFHSDGTQTRPRRGFKFCYRPARRWREDGRCGYSFPHVYDKRSNGRYGSEGECNPLSTENGKGPCCSSHGFCGPFSVHCDCATCVNYKKGHPGCNAADNQISCCPRMTLGDNNGDVFGGKEIFLQENQIIESTCQANCQRLHPESVGITESTTQKYNNGQPKCWCEFGSPHLVKPNCANHHTCANYQTCLFNH